MKGQWGPCVARFQVEEKRQTVKWIDGPDITGSNGVDNDDLDVKPGKDESFRKRGAPQLEVRGLDLE